MIQQQITQLLARFYILGLLCAVVGGIPTVLFAMDFWKNSPAPAMQPHSTGSIVFGTFVVVLALGGVIAVVCAILMQCYPHWHPVRRRLACYGPPDEVVEAMDDELSNTEEMVAIGEPVKSFRMAKSLFPQVFVTRSWVVQLTDYGMRVARLADVVWVRETIRFPNEHAVEVKVRRGKDERFAMTAANTRRLLLELLTRLPWVLSGFDPQREQQWQTDRDKVIQATQQEREQIQSLSPDARRALVDDKVKRLEER